MGGRPGFPCTDGGVEIADPETGRMRWRGDRPAQRATVVGAPTMEPAVPQRPRLSLSLVWRR